jgi:hypothetical protein
MTEKIGSRGVLVERFQRVARGKEKEESGE